MYVYVVNMWLGKICMYVLFCDMYALCLKILEFGLCYCTR